MVIGRDLADWIDRVDRWPKDIRRVRTALPSAIAAVNPSDTADPDQFQRLVTTACDYLLIRGFVRENDGRYALKRLARLLLDGRTSLDQIQSEAIRLLTPVTTSEDYWPLARTMQVAGVTERNLALPLLNGPIGAIVHARLGRSEACAMINKVNCEKESLLTSIRSLCRASTWLRLSGFAPDGRFDGRPALLRQRPVSEWQATLFRMIEAESTITALDHDPVLLKSFKREHRLTALRATSCEQREAADRSRIEAIVYADRNAGLRAKAPSAAQVFRPRYPRRSS